MLPVLTRFRGGGADRQEAPGQCRVPQLPRQALQGPHPPKKLTPNPKPKHQTPHPKSPPHTPRRTLFDSRASSMRYGLSEIEGCSSLHHTHSLERVEHTTLSSDRARASGHIAGPALLPFQQAECPSPLSLNGEPHRLRCHPLPPKGSLALTVSGGVACAGGAPPQPGQATFHQLPLKCRLPWGGAHPGDVAGGVAGGAPTPKRPRERELLYPSSLTQLAPAWWPRNRTVPHGGVRPLHQKSTCLTQLTLGSYVVQI